MTAVQYDATYSLPGARNYVERNGKDAFLALLQRRWPKHDLYAFSTSWLTDGFGGAMKAQGVRGDILVQFDTRSIARMERDNHGGLSL
jgi:hypothetical protein